MDPTQAGVGNHDNLTIRSEIAGTTEIITMDQIPMKIGESRIPIVYKGSVKSGTDSQSVEAYIFLYKCQDSFKDVVERLHKQRSISDHPNVMRSLGHSKGTKAHARYMCVAFPKFSYTFADLLRPGSSATEMGRLSESFIEVVSGIVKGLIVLDKHGLGCPNLKPGHISILLENNSVTAKIWYYTACSSDNRAKAWVELGRMIMDAATKNSAYSDESLEITDLCTKMINGKLKGLDILEHSALLSVQKKFKNVLSLWMHISINCPPPPPPLVNEKQKDVEGEDKQKSSDKDVPKPKSAYTLEEYLDVKDPHKSSRPYWIQKKRKKSEPKTFRELVDELRDLIEHEVEYVPENMTRDLTTEERLAAETHSDLERSVRKSWPEDFLKMQLWASNPTIKITDQKRSSGKRKPAG